MKIKHLVLLVGCACAAVFCRAKSSSEVTLDRSTAELSAYLLLEKLQADILSDEPDVALLFHEMSENPGSYIEPDLAKEKLETIFRQALSDRYYDAAGKYLDRLAGEAGRNDFFSEAFLKETLLLPEASLAERVNQTYGSAFNEARVSVCRKQAQTLVAEIQPSETEFEQIPREVLTATLTTRIAEAQKQPVFQENLAYISDALVKPMLKEAEQQRKAQRAFIDAQLIDGWAPDTIAYALNAELVKHVQVSAEQYQDEGRIAYGVFPSIVAVIPALAKKHAVNKIIRVIDEMIVDIDSDLILETIERDPEKHRTAAASMEAFSPQLEDKLEDDAFAYCEKRMSVEEWKLFETFGRASLKDGPIRTAVIQRVRKGLLPHVKAVREAFAQHQVIAGFPDLMMQRWYPSGALVDNITAQVDYRKAVKAWREIPEMTRFAEEAAERLLMEESERMLDAVVETLFERGQRVQTRQHGIVNEVFTEIKSAIGREGELLNIAAAIGFYTQKVKEVWDADRDEVLWGGRDMPRPENAAEQHVALFPSTEERILLKVKSLMESLEHEQKEQEAKPEIPPEEVPPEKPESDAAGSEKPELIALNCRFEFDQRGSDIHLGFYVDDERIAVLSCSHSPRRYRREFSKTVERAVSALIREMKAYTASGSSVMLAVNIIVKNDLVYYGIVDRLVYDLNEKAGTLLETGVELNLVSPMMEK